MNERELRDTLINNRSNNDRPVIVYDNIYNYYNKCNGKSVSLVECENSQISILL